MRPTVRKPSITFQPWVLLLLLGALLAATTTIMLAAPPQQVPIIGVDAVATPTPDQTPVLVPTAEGTKPVLSIEGYHQHARTLHYVVQPGDTLLDVALETGAEIAILLCAITPHFQPNEPLVIGDMVTVPPNGTECHRSNGKETLNEIAAYYQVTPAMIRAVPWNGLASLAGDLDLPAGRNIQIPPPLLAGDHLNSQVRIFADQADRITQSVVAEPNSGSFLTWMLAQPVDTSPFLALAVGGPFANQKNHEQRKLSRATRAVDRPGAVPENWPYGSGNFAWPLAGWLTQGYRYDHRAIDIAAPSGTIVTAADRGVVLRAGWNNLGYGLFVIIDHNIDYITLYAHLSDITVEEGAVVAQGDVIGTVGSTGNSTGPHLHFEIRDFGRLANPLELLVH